MTMTAPHRLTAMGVCMGALLLIGCAGSVQQRAITAGTIAREVVDTGADALRAHMTERATACRSIAERAAFDACLGPVASDPKAVAVALEGVRSAQVALWLALASGDEGQMQSARGKLMGALGQLARLVRRAKDAKQ